MKVILNMLVLILLLGFTGCSDDVQLSLKELDLVGVWKDKTEGTEIKITNDRIIIKGLPAGQPFNHDGTYFYEAEISSESGCLYVTLFTESERKLRAHLQLSNMTKNSMDITNSLSSYWYIYHMERE